MIDCHAHAFPPTQKQLQRLALGESLSQLVEPAERLSGPLGDHLSEASTRVNLTIERLSAFRRQTHPLVRGVTEFVFSLGIGAPVVLCGTLDRLTDSMERHGLSHSVVIAAPPLVPNAWLLDEAARDPRIIPVVNQAYDDPDSSPAALRAAYDTLTERGAAGYKIHPNLSGLPADHPVNRAIFECAREHDRFVILHTGRFAVPGYRNLRPADPHEYEPLFAAYPEVRVCLAHMNRDDPAAVWELLARHERLFTDTSWQPAEVIRQALDTVGPERLLLGSDWPLLHTDLQGDALATLRRAASDDEWARVTDENARAFLQI